MAITWTFDAGRPDHDWEYILFDIFQNGFFDNIAGATEINLTSTLLPNYVLHLTGTNLTSDGDAVLDSGSDITGFELSDGGTVVWSMTGLTGVSAATINQVILDVVALAGTVPQDYYSQEFKDILSALINSNFEAEGSGDADSIFGSDNVAGDIINGNGGDDYIRGGGFDTNFDSLDGGDGFDYLDLSHDGFEGTGVVVDVNAGEVRTNDLANTLVASINNFEGYGLTDGDDIFIGGGGDEFIQGLDGSDQIDGGGGWDKLSYRDETGGLGIIVNVDAGTVRDTYNNTDYVINVEGFKGSQYGDVFIGSGANHLNDYFEGMDGIDFFLRQRRPRHGGLPVGI